MIQDILHTTGFFDLGKLPIILMAVLVTSLIGAAWGPALGNANPFLWTVIDKIGGGLGDRLDRKQRTRADLLFRGAMLLAIMVVIIMVILKALQFLAHQIAEHHAIEVICLVATLTSGTVWNLQCALFKAVEKKTVGQGAYYNLATSARLNLSAADDFTITRAAITFSADILNRGMIAPVFWYLVLGMPAAWLYTIVAAFVWRFGKGGTGTGFAGLALALRDAMDFIPSFITVVIIKCAAFITPGAKVMPQAKGSRVIAAMASSLNISLAGPVQDITGHAIKNDWIGPDGATAQSNHKHLKRTVFLSVTAHIILIFVLLLLYLIDNGISPTFMLDFFA